MLLVVFGSQSLTNKYLFESVLRRGKIEKVDGIVTGYRIGIESSAAGYAEQKGVHCIRFEKDSSDMPISPKEAGQQRDLDMIEFAETWEDDIVAVVIWQGKSKRISRVIDLLTKRKITIYEWLIDYKNGLRFTIRKAEAT